MMMGDYEVPVYYHYIPGLGYMVMLVDLYALSRNGTGTFIQHKAVIYCKVLQLWWPSCQKPCHEGFHFLTQGKIKPLHEHIHLGVCSCIQIGKIPSKYLLCSLWEKGIVTLAKQSASGKIY